ncbi:serine protease [Corynebacterium sp. Q4381]|uniref:serine protease n=1 Tax=Corynebacterium sp. Marseille-Q4381 TaxID=3121597 RepID=UPI002FE58B2C
MHFSPAHLVRITAPGGYCSGTLIGPETVLTCGHFLASADAAAVRCAVSGVTRRARAVEFYSHTDIAVVHLDSPVETAQPFPRFGTPPKPFTPTVTFGFGGRARQPAARVGRFITTLPFAVSRSGTTVVRPAGLIANAPRAIKGDSGGPVIADGRVVAVQSLILDPFGRNLGLATVSLLS